MSELQDLHTKLITYIQFEELFDTVAKHVHETAVEKGWWDGSGDRSAAVFMNIAAEVSEAWEGYRKRNPDSDKIPTSLIEEELADVIIRIMDAAAYYGWDVAHALTLKAQYNENRDYRHGNKLA